jgi:hypothetical protein
MPPIQNLQDKIGFRQNHDAATETMTTKKSRFSTVDTLALSVDELRNVDGSVMFNRSGRRLNEVADGGNPGAGKGILWINSTGSRATFTDDTNADTDLTLVDIGSVLTVGNDALNQELANVGALKMNATANGIRIGYDGGNTVATNASSIALGYSALTGAVANGTAIGAYTAVSLAGSTAIGSLSEATAYASSLTNHGVIVGSKTSTFGDNVCIGFELNGNATNADAGGCVFIANNVSSLNAYATDNAVMIGMGTQAATTSVIIGSNSHNTTSSLTTSVVVGTSAGTLTPLSASNIVCIGHEANVANTCNNSTVLGYGASSASYDNVCVGNYAFCNNYRSVAVGKSATSGEEYSVSIGRVATASAYRSVAIGANTSVSSANDYACVLGGDVTLRESTAPDNVLSVAGYREFAGTQTTTDATPTVLVTAALGLTVGSAVRVDASVVGYKTDNTGTVMASFDKYLYRRLASAKPEITKLTTTNAYPPIQGQYFTLYNGPTGYYVWMDTVGDATTGDPAPGGGLLEIAVNVSGVTNAPTLATAIAGAINTILGGTPAAAVGNVVTITTPLSTSTPDSVNVNVTNLLLEKLQDGHPAGTSLSSSTTSLETANGYDDPDTLGYPDPTLTLSGNDIILTVTGAIGHTVLWRGEIRVWCSGDTV